MHKNIHELRQRKVLPKPKGTNKSIKKELEKKNKKQFANKIVIIFNGFIRFGFTSQMKNDESNSFCVDSMLFLSLMLNGLISFLRASTH